jgi:hypothetical protein
MSPLADALLAQFFFNQRMGDVGSASSERTISIIACPLSILQPGQKDTTFFYRNPTNGLGPISQVASRNPTKDYA